LLLAQFDDLADRLEAAHCRVKCLARYPARLRLPPDTVNESTDAVGKGWACGGHGKEGSAASKDSTAGDGGLGGPGNAEHDSLETEAAPVKRRPQVPAIERQLDTTILRHPINIALSASTRAIALP